MTGPEHYVEAERLLAAEVLDDDVARAQVHATLALAAAVGVALASPELVDGHRIGDGEAWERVASVLAVARTIVDGEETRPAGRVDAAGDDDVVEAVIYCSGCDHPDHAGTACRHQSGAGVCGCMWGVG